MTTAVPDTFQPSHHPSLPVLPASPWTPQPSVPVSSAGTLSAGPSSHTSSPVSASPALRPSPTSSSSPPLTPAHPSPSRRLASPAPALTSSRRAHLLSKAKLLRQQREAAQQAQIARLAVLQSPPAISAAPHSSSHPLDPLISADDALHTRYTLQSLALSRALASQQNRFHEMEAVVERLQVAIRAEVGLHHADGGGVVGVEAENGVLREWVRVLQGRVEEREAEVEVMRGMMQRKSARIGEVREESAVMVEEMRAMLTTLTREKERREREMREEREALLTGLREMIDVVVRENEWMRLRMTEEQNRALAQWKEDEMAVKEERDEEREAIRRKERAHQQQAASTPSRAAPQATTPVLVQQETRRQEEEQRREDQRWKDVERAAQLREAEELKHPEPPPASVCPPIVISAPVPSHWAVVPTASSKRVHFRQPSASPTFLYSPASMSTPASPVTLPLTEVQLEALPPPQSHLPPSSAAAQKSMLDGFQQQQLQRTQLFQPPVQHFTPSPFIASATTPIQRYSPLPPRQQAGVNGYPSPFTAQRSLAASQSSPPSPSRSQAPSTTMTASSAPASPLSSYFDGAADFLQPHTASPPSELQLPPTAPTDAVQRAGTTTNGEGAEGRKEADGDRAGTNGAGGVAAARAFKAPAVVPVSLSDQMMGRIGGWMMGGRAPPASRALNTGGGGTGHVYQ